MVLVVGEEDRERPRLEKSKVDSRVAVLEGGRAFGAKTEKERGKDVVGVKGG